MRKMFKFLLKLILVLALVACSSTKDEVPIEDIGDKLPVIVDNNSPENSGKILIAYFTWAENTVVENPAAIDVDASTSASVLLPGNASKMATWIQEQTGGDLFSIIVSENYSSDYDECLSRASYEKANNARPSLVNHVSNMDDYDTIFLGFPNWWYTLPMAIHSFIEEYDFSNKTVIPFVTHGTGGLSSTIRDLGAALPDSAKVLEPIGIYRNDIDSSQDVLLDWLVNLGFNKVEDDQEQISKNRKIIMKVNDESIEITLYDNAAANSLYQMLPLELTLEDYNQIEKIAYLPDELAIDSVIDSFDPNVGDFALYAPWGNLSIFYKDFRESEGLISLGRIESGIEIIAGLDSDITITLEALE